jgi:UPF0716 protein FxsA
MALVLLILFIVLPIAEIYVIVQVGQAIGIWPTLAILLVDGFVGAALARSQGRAAWARFNLALAEGRVPARETFDGAMIIVGGAFLLAPGFITDVVGFLLLIPPMRALVRGAVARLALGRLAFVWTIARPRRGAGPDPRRRGPVPHGRSQPSSGYDYEGTAREVSDPSAELPPSERRD